ncbi:hypothetical protein A2U01_0111273 [Trifolium medium]|uniref:Uncharacterized protein n=1 Tax=Trifolium medium TaxID=97028 RepID=A0A392VNM8_9FABA|nr:hypothetical protein [Trifolium medium]
MPEPHSQDLSQSSSVPSSISQYDPPPSRDATLPFIVRLLAFDSDEKE